jgi:hypothetical protein
MRPEPRSGYTWGDARVPFDPSARTGSGGCCIVRGTLCRGREAGRSCTASWHLFAHRGLPRLSGVDAVEPGDVWAVGGRAGKPDSSAGDRPAVVHSDGTRIAVQILPWKGGWFSAVAALSDDDVWAVGSSAAGPLAAHLVGHRWHRVGTPHVAGGHLADVAAISHDDVWAVGTVSARGSDRPHPLVMHWNGREWGLVHLPGSSPPWELVSVDFASADDVWAFGYTGPWVGPYGYGPVVLHWNGRRWTTVQSGIGASDFKDWAYGALDVSPSGEVWIGVGEQPDARSSSPRFVRWSGAGHRGTRSYVMPYSFTGGDSRPDVMDLAAVSTNELWAVGDGPALTHLNIATGSWRRAHLPVPVASLTAISAISPADIWTVGGHLILRYHYRPRAGGCPAR